MCFTCFVFQQQFRLCENNNICLLRIPHKFEVRLKGFRPCDAVGDFGRQQRISPPTQYRGEHMKTKYMELSSLSRVPP